MGKWEDYFLQGINAGAKMWHDERTIQQKQGLEREKEKRLMDEFNRQMALQKQREDRLMDEFNKQHLLRQREMERGETHDKRLYDREDKKDERFMQELEARGMTPNELQFSKESNPYAAVLFRGIEAASEKIRREEQERIRPKPDEVIVKKTDPSGNETTRKSYVIPPLQTSLGQQDTTAPKLSVFDESTLRAYDEQVAGYENEIEKHAKEMANGDYYSGLFGMFGSRKHKVSELQNNVREIEKKREEILKKYRGESDEESSSLEKLKFAASQGKLDDELLKYFNTHINGGK